MQLEGYILKRAEFAQVAHLEQHFIRRHGLARGNIVFAVRFAADHLLIERVFVRVLRGHFRRKLAILEYVNAVGDFQNLLQSVRNEDYGISGFLHGAHTIEQHLHFLIGKNGGRFIQQDDRSIISGFGYDIQAFGDFHHLAHGERQIADLRVGLDVRKSHIRKRLFRRRVHLAPIDQSRRFEAALAAQIDILRHGQIADHRLFLKHHADAVAVCVQHRSRLERLAAHFHCAHGRRNNAGYDLHQRGFARAVFTDQTDDFTAPDRNIDALQDGIRSVDFADAVRL